MAKDAGAVPMLAHGSSLPFVSITMTTRVGTTGHLMRLRKVSSMNTTWGAVRQIRMTTLTETGVENEARQQCPGIWLKRFDEH